MKCSTVKYKIQYTVAFSLNTQGAMDLDDCDVLGSEGSTDAKKRKTGIVYLSTIPPLMNVRVIRQYFSEYGTIGRIFLQPQKSAAWKNKPSRNFSEGWIEFTSKRRAKAVAELLNNKQVGGKKKSQQFDSLWNVKYLPRFKWAHLDERLAYERAAHKQKLRNEIAQAKREVNFFARNVERSQIEKQMAIRLNKKAKKRKQDGGEEPTENKSRREAVEFDYSQRRTDEQIRSVKSKEHPKEHSANSNNNRERLLKSVFA